MRFLMLNWRDPKNPISGGAERVTLAHLAALAERGHQVYWYTFDFPGGAREEMFEGIKIVRGGGKASSIFKAYPPGIDDRRNSTSSSISITACRGSRRGGAKPIAWPTSAMYSSPAFGAHFHSLPVSTIGRWQERWITLALSQRAVLDTIRIHKKRFGRAHGIRDVTVIANGIDTIAIAGARRKTNRTHHFG